MRSTTKIVCLNVFKKSKKCRRQELFFRKCALHVPRVDINTQVWFCPSTNHWHRRSQGGARPPPLLKRVEGGGGAPPLRQAPKSSYSLKYYKIVKKWPENACREVQKSKNFLTTSPVASALKLGLQPRPVPPPLAKRSCYTLALWDRISDPKGT